jgi:hypothetical protein
MSDWTDLPTVGFQDPIPAQGPVVFHAPASGWSQGAYQAAISAFIRARGRAPQTITLHPETLSAAMRMTVVHEAQRAAEEFLDVVRHEEQVLQPILERAKHELSVVTSDVHDRDTIVMT